MSLPQLQQDFCAYLLDKPNKIESAVAGDMAVYHHAYRAQLLTCLRDTFEKTWSWIGDDAFDTAARAHIEAHPPSAWTLNVYGEGFDTTLATLHPADPEIAELARLEWRLRRAFDGPDSQAVDAADLASVDWEKARLEFVPTLSLDPVTTNCAAIWSALAEETTPPAAALLPVPAAIRVWRLELSARFRSINPAEERALQLGLAGADFAEICEVLAEDGEATEIGRILGLWLQDGLIAAVHG